MVKNLIKCTPTSTRTKMMVLPKERDLCKMDALFQLFYGIHDDNAYRGACFASGNLLLL